MTTFAGPAPARPGTALWRMLLGPELTQAERDLIRAVLERAPKLPAVTVSLSARSLAARRVSVVTAVLAAMFGLSLITAPPAEAFSIFGPVKRAFSDAINAFLDAIAQAECDFVGDLVGGILRYADQGLAINFGVDWFKQNYENMMLGGFLMGLAIFIIQCIAAALRRNPAQMLQALTATLLGVFASFVSLSLIMMVSAGIDGWCGAITGGSNVANGTENTVKALPKQIGPVGAMLTCAFYLLFAIALFLILIVRRLGIYVIALFIPVYAGGLAGGWTSHMVKRSAEMLFVLLMSKLAITGTFRLGASMVVGDTKALDAPVQALSGVVVIGFAVLSPMGVMYLMAFADGLLVGQMASAGHHARQGAAGARNQVRGHDGRGNRSALGRVTGAGQGRVRKDQQGGAGGGRGVIASARRAAQRVRPGGTSGTRPGGRGPNDSVRQSRARGARRAAGRPTEQNHTGNRTSGRAGPSPDTPFEDNPARRAE